MAEKKSRRPKRPDYRETVERTQSILINAAEGQRSIADDRQYPPLRKELLKWVDETPRLVATHPTVDSFVAHITRYDPPERVRLVRQDFKRALNGIRQRAGEGVDSSKWTGEQSRGARLRTVRTLLPLAQAGVESMIATLSEENPNGAPILDERLDALKHLRELHRTLGELLAAVDAGQFEDELGQSLLAQAARYAKRAARSLRDDPMPYLSSALLLGIFEACGLPGIGGYLGGVALNIRKHGGKRTLPQADE